MNVFTRTQSDVVQLAEQISYHILSHIFVITIVIAIVVIFSTFLLFTYSLVLLNSNFSVC